jgi:hypothetical protein
MDGWQGAVKLHGRPQFFESHIRFAPQQRLHLSVMGVQDERFAPRIAVTRSDVSGTPALLQEFLDQTQRDTKAVGNFFTVSFLLVVGTEDSFTQVQGCRSQEQILSHPEMIGYSFI